VQENGETKQNDVNEEEGSRKRQRLDAKAQPAGSGAADKPKTVKHSAINFVEPAAAKPPAAREKTAGEAAEEHQEKRSNRASSREARTRPEGARTERPRRGSR
jgi:hypothetical protein